MLSKLNRSIRVVMFGSGPKLTHDAREFIFLLEVNPEIELLGAFCQSESQTLSAVIKDLWHRRGVLAFPLFFSDVISELLHLCQNPSSEKTLRNKLKQISERIHYVKDIHSKGVLDIMHSLQPDLGLIYGSPILKRKLFGIPKLGTLGIHHGKLPDYRGNKTAFWAIYNGETAAGVTIQKINEGLDTGNIVKEGEVLIGKKSYSRVVRELEVLGLNLYIQTILEIKNGTATILTQPAIKGRLYRNPKLGDFIQFWLKQPKRLLGRIR